MPRFSLLVLLIMFTVPSLAQRGARVSPFTDVVVSDDTVAVVYQGTSYELISVGGIPTARILAHCRATDARRWEDRFCTDLVEVMAALDTPLASTVRLELRDPRTQRVVTVDRAPMTPENRTAVYESLQNRRCEQRDRPLRNLTPPQMKHALDLLDRALHDRWSYVALSNFDFKPLLTALRGRTDRDLTGPDFLIEVQSILSHGIDGHASIDAWENFLPPGSAPFLVEPLDDRYVAFLPDRSDFLADGHPYIESIDGRPVAEWIDAASRYVPKGSPHFVRQRSARLLRAINLLRRDLKIEPKPTLAVVVSSPDVRRRTLQLPLAKSSPVYTVWPPEDHDPKLPKGIAYLRLTDMPIDPLPRATIHTAFSVARQSDAKGMILDVRDNGGGARDTLRHLAPLLMPPDGKPRVVNAAVYRLHPEHTPDLMESRYLYPETWRNWTRAERDAIAEFKKTFEPERAPPKEGFSDWHYMVLSPAKPDAARFDKPVVVLMNAKCFSATDVFLSALKGLPDVTLVGTPSGGGSANITRIPLGVPNLEARLGSMISFQSTGELFDTRGVGPDLTVHPTPDFFLGRSDPQLAEAIRIVQFARPTRAVP